LGSDLERVEKDVEGGGTGGWLSGLWGAQEVGKGAKVGSMDIWGISEELIGVSLGSWGTLSWFFQNLIYLDNFLP
jgi:hypothetical protein